MASSLSLSLSVSGDVLRGHCSVDDPSKRKQKPKDIAVCQLQFCSLLSPFQKPVTVNVREVRRGSAHRHISLSLSRSLSAYLSSAPLQSLVYKPADVT